MRARRPRNWASASRRNACRRRLRRLARPRAASWCLPERVDALLRSWRGRADVAFVARHDPRTHLARLCEPGARAAARISLLLPGSCDTPRGTRAGAGESAASPDRPLAAGLTPAVAKVRAAHWLHDLRRRQRG